MLTVSRQAPVSVSSPAGGCCSGVERSGEFHVCPSDGALVLGCFSRGLLTPAGGPTQLLTPASKWAGPWTSQPPLLSSSEGLGDFPAFGILAHIFPNVVHFPW